MYHNKVVGWYHFRDFHKYNSLRMLALSDAFNNAKLIQSLDKRWFMHSGTKDCEEMHVTPFFFVVMVYSHWLMGCLHWPRPRPRPKPMELGFMIMFGSGYTEPRPRLMQISIGSVHILSVSASVSDGVNNPQDQTEKFTIYISGLPTNFPVLSSGSRSMWLSH